MNFEKFAQRKENNKFAITESNLFVRSMSDVVRGVATNERTCYQQLSPTTQFVPQSYLAHSFIQVVGGRSHQSRPHRHRSTLIQSSDVICEYKHDRSVRRTARSAN